MRAVLFEQVLDPPVPGSKKRTSGRVSFGVLKYYLEAGGAQDTEAARLVARSRDRPAEPGQTSASEAGPSAPGLSLDALVSCKRAARKILTQCHSNIADVVAKLDHLDEGIVSRDDLKKALEGQRVSDLDRDELTTLLKGCDRGSKGYVASSKFIDKLYAFAAEAEGEAVLRRLAKAVSHSDTNLKQELSRYDTSGRAKLDKATFKRCLKQLSIALSDAEIQKLMPPSGPGTRTTAAQKADAEMIDIASFCQQVTEAGRAKPLPSFVLQGAKGGAGKGRSGHGASALGVVDAEKKYKKNLEALKTDIEEKNREIEGLHKEVKDCHDRYNRLDAEKKHLETRLLDRHSKPPRETQNEAQAHSQTQQLAQVREQLFAQQSENTKLRKTIEVTLKAETSRLSAEKEQLEEKLRDSQEERARLQGQFNRLVGQPMDTVDRREALELSRQMRIAAQEKELEEGEAHRAEVQDALFKAEEKLLDLKFEKESFDLQYARLQKRIQELEQHQHSSAKMSAVLRAE